MAIVEVDGVIVNEEADLLAMAKTPAQKRSALALLDLERDLRNRDWMSRTRGQERGDELTTQALDNFDLRKAGID